MAPDSESSVVLDVCHLGSGGLGAYYYEHLSWAQGLE